MTTNATSNAALLQHQGAAQAGGALAGGQAWGALPSALAGGLGIYSGLGGTFGGGASNPAPAFGAATGASAGGLGNFNLNQGIFGGTI